MLEFYANENATVDLVENRFPLGLRDTVKIHILDQKIIDLLDLKSYGQCSEQNNMFTYGYFDIPPEDKDVITTSFVTKLDENGNEVKYSNVDYGVVSGVNNNDSQCMRIKLDADDKYIQFKADKDKLQPGVKYKFSFLSTHDDLILNNYASCDTDDSSIKCSRKHVYITKTKYEKAKGWYLYTSSVFSLPTEEEKAEEAKAKRKADRFKRLASINQVVSSSEGNESDAPISGEEDIFEIRFKGDIGEFYLDNLSLFNVEDELSEASNDIKLEIEIVNPVQYDVKIDRVIRWNKTETDVYALMYVPPITVVDYQDKITCKLKVYAELDGKYNLFGDYLYTDKEEVIYTSELFNLQGCILAPGINWEHILDAELHVERI